MRIAILGGGQAAASMAAKLRAAGHDGPLNVHTDEAISPYQRPPLSKAYMLGRMGTDRLVLRGDDWWTGQGITLHLDSPVTAIDRAARQIVTPRGHFGYDALALCLGAAPRRLSAAQGGDLTGVFVMRDLADADALAPQLVAGRRAVVVGGGYIGLEAASVAASLGLEVTVIEMRPRILGRVASHAVAEAVRALHARHGVEIIENVSLSRIEGDGKGRATGVRLADGRLLAADLVISGIGIKPRTRLAEAAGLDIDDGIAVDALGRSSDPAIWAAGDCASIPAPEARFGTRLRLESVSNAIDMGDAVAANILGAGQPYRPKPWFWSDQYDAKLQIAGLGTGADHFITRQAEGDSLSVWAFIGDRLVSVEALNAPRDYMVGKRLIDAGRSPDRAAVADLSLPVKSLMQGGA